MAYGALRKKLVRDMRQSLMQFLSIVVLCSLGTLIFAALDGTARLAQGTIDVYFQQNHLADFWVSVASADRQTLARVRGISGVEDVCARATVEVQSTLPGEPDLNITAYNGPMSINRPYLEKGELLAENDLRGCLIQAGFARVHGLDVGERVTVKLNGTEFYFVIRGIIYSPEFICVTKGTYPNPEEYGYILVNAEAVPELPLAQIVVTVQEGADEQNVESAIQQALPDALILNRRAHPSTASAISNAEMFADLRLVFPLMAYAVAALIVLTTLTRMIDNQRLQIGTLKALGYSNRSIRDHYLSYAIWPSLVGSVLGVVVGHQTLPRVLWALLLGQNEFPYRVYPSVSAVSWGMAALTVIMSICICLYTYHRSGRETTAELLRPKPPKAGKRILLERIGWLWRRFDFNTKMIVRNLMRNRMRTIMSLVGVLCCNGLIIASFGLQDSVNGLARTHYGETLSYDVRANLAWTADEAASYAKRLEAARVECIMESSVSVRSQQTGRTALLTVVEPEQQLLHLGRNEQLVPIAPGGVAVTEKLCDTLNVQIGDPLELFFPGDRDPVTVPVTQVVYNYVQQGVYMDEGTWEALRKGSFAPTALLLESPTEACLQQLDEMEEVESLDWPSQQSRDLTDMLDLLSSVFILLMGVALALAFVICYNMGLMNFAERTREYATLKVLGYHQREIRKLIVGENSLVSLIGVLLSIWPGIALISLVLRVCQTETMCYPSSPNAFSVALACVITYGFSLLIQLLLVRKVRGIDMVEALKSVE